MSRHLLGMDTETKRFRPGKMAPRLVCVTMAGGITATGNVHAEIAHHSQVDLRFIETLLEHDVVCHFAAYDFAVLCAHEPKALGAVYAAYTLGRIHDTMIREQMLDISCGQLKFKGYSLANLAHKYLGKTLDKETYRLEYGDLIDVPLERWTPGAVEYALEDARAPLQIYHAQELQRHCVAGDVFADANRQAAYSFVRRLMTCWGMVTDAARVAALKKKTLADMDALRLYLIEAGLMRVEAKGKYKGKVTRNLEAIRAAVSAAYGDKVPVTDKGNVSTARETLAAHPDLKPVSDYVSLQKLHSTYIRVLEKGTRGGVIHGEFNLKETGRCGATENMQTLPSAGDVRACYRPRAGYVFGAIDYNTIELRAWAQTMVDWLGLYNVPMALMYQRDPDADPHTKFAAEHFMRVSYEAGLSLKASIERAAIEGRPLTDDEKAFKTARKAAKAANFGFPGGLGAAAFVRFARNNYGYIITEQQARDIKRGWSQTWNAQPFFDRVNYDANKGYTVQGWSKRIRGGLGFCDCANDAFQPRAADGLFQSLLRISYECYVQVPAPHSKPSPVTMSPLYGSRPVNEIHDELIMEYPRENASDALKRTETLMLEGMGLVCPDVPIRVSGALMAAWYKDAPRKVAPDGTIEVYAP